MHNESKMSGPAASRGRSSGDSVVSAASASASALDVEVEREVARAMRDGGIAAGLGVLNARTRYRFTGLYRIDDGELRSICLFDREHPTLCATGDVVLLRDTYCGIVAASRQPFSTADARRDPRAAAVAPRSWVVSYCGVPVACADGGLGTLCHFDLRPRLYFPGEVAVMARVAALFAPSVAQVSAVGP